MRGFVLWGKDMFELIKLGKNTYYIDCPSKVGVYVYNKNDAMLIDSENDEDSARKILRILKENNLNLKMIVNTHSHADHIGGNGFLQKRTNCKIYAPEIEEAFVNNTILESSLMYSAKPFLKLQNKYFKAKESNAEKIDVKNLPDGVEIISLKGHSPNHVGIKTPDDVIFIGDSLISVETLEKYHIAYLFDAKEYLNTLKMLENLKASCFVPSHAEASSDIKRLVKLNIDKAYEIIDKILDMLKEEKTQEEIIQKIILDYNLKQSLNQYIIVKTTIKAYLSYLCDEGIIDFCFKDGKMYWLKVN